MKNKFIKQLFTFCAASVFAMAAFTASAQDSEPENPSALPLEEIEMFAQVFSKIKSDYVDAIDEKKMLIDAINGMLAGLDPHSAFLDKNSFKDFRIDAEGEFGGVGIEVAAENAGIRVVSPIEDTPADRAGVEAGDIILGIDGKSIVGQSLSKAVEKMRGEVGSTITLTLSRQGTEKPFDIEIVRDVIQLTSVKTRDLGVPGYAYMRVTKFQSTSAQNLKRKVKKFQQEQTIKGLILDLRNNPGGVLSGAVDISDLFLEMGADIVATHGRSDDSESAFKADSGDLLNGAPIVVLVNNGSASASEIVAGALQDHDRAIILGTTSYGKGSVQTISQLPSGSALKLTTARYYTPNGRSIQETGIAPDIVSQRSELIKTERRKRPREVDLDRHLVNEGKPAEEQKKPEKPVGDQATKEWLAKDSQLREALNLLKGINLANAGRVKKAG